MPEDRKSVLSSSGVPAEDDRDERSEARSSGRNVLIRHQNPPTSPRVPRPIRRSALTSARFPGPSAEKAVSERERTSLFQHIIGLF